MYCIYASVFNTNINSIIGLRLPEKQKGIQIKITLYCYV